VPRAADSLASLDRGRLAIGIFGVPYKCAPAPYELALLAQERFRERGSRASVAVFTPQPMSLPILGKAGCASIEDRLAGRGIEFRPDSKTERVEAGRVVLAGGGEVPFDLLFSVPPHRVPNVVVESGLAEQGGWVTVNPRTLETPFEGVYAVGDVTVIPMANKQPMPKAGVFAEREGEVAAERIAAKLDGRKLEATFDGVGFCFLEIGNEEAMFVRGHFLADPEPDVELTPPSRQAFLEKTMFERDRLEAWFGPAL
jgi:sulfide:quinone oxidoreductase